LNEIVFLKGWMNIAVMLFLGLLQANMVNRSSTVIQFRYGSFGFAVFKFCFRQIPSREKNTQKWFDYGFRWKWKSPIMVSFVLENRERWIVSIFSNEWILSIEIGKIYDLYDIIPLKELWQVMKSFHVFAWNFLNNIFHFVTVIPIKKVLSTIIK